MKSDVIAKPERFLSPEFSVFLDLCRFLAAFVVVAAHVAQDGLYTGPGAMPMWLGHSAVLVFFVISGVVIFESASRPGQTLKAFAIARLSCLYSVVVPAIALSFFLAWSVPLQWPDASAALTPHAGLWVAVSSLLFLNESWTNDAKLPWNAPFWSLCYEAWYYVLLAVVVFLKGKLRIALVVVASLLAGPRILILLPVWLLGVWLITTSVHRRLGVSTASFIAATAVVCFVVVSNDAVADAVLNGARESIPGWWRLAYSSYAVTDLIGGVCVAGAFVAFRALVPRMKSLLMAVAPVAKLLAGFSFSLYLFHRPLTKALAASGVVGASSFSAQIALLVAIVLSCFVLSLFTERQRPLVESVMIKAVSAVARVRR